MLSMQEDLHLNIQPEMFDHFSENNCIRITGFTDLVAIQDLAAGWRYT